MSGVSRLRASRSGGGSLSIDHVSQPSGRNGSARDCATPKDFGPPKKKGAWEEFPVTGVPTGNESPHRGENTNAPVRVKSIQ